MSPSSPLSEKKFAELSRPQQVLVVLLAVVQLSLAVAAWADLARRPADKINGSKLRWALTIAVNFFGPIRYFRKGRRD
ncbi:MULTISPECIES: PLDc N-terminal domain-containing protein [Rhodococcus]|uniref:PLDc N-terminal domain-containing protein n=1 Tax=Rhodococcus TaxID=1827 RepID=UPI001E4CA202|nr:PLDc N-terminal domain-containing protein [Rhodococcus pyridinivorans]MCD2119334.1 PLDc N-terminal domain-containing protein [Rhodococcus pyridinivorans]MCZ4628259.1 PLDc N-terminal domain-containing protein [Rhodococcus pyridinivorans]MCZ4649520.1 PLDc N-terminal domain-containing protein [Rhodococcus pyridinivorans]MDJ0483117.1 PLDc N-terminal domain-containing protein [Rhodococcus pyridinivorans]MDV7255574.1 PLDc N-terminal domain-containing protein [Rhodococcus pyridinivorans]